MIGVLLLTCFLTLLNCVLFRVARSERRLNEKALAENKNAIAAMEYIQKTNEAFVASAVLQAAMTRAHRPAQKVERAS